MVNTISNMLNTTITVTRPATATVKGGKTVTFNAHLSAVPARVHQMSGSEAQQYGAERGVNPWRISVEPSRDIQRGDRVTYTDVLGNSHTIDIEEARGSSAAGVIRVLVGTEVEGD